MWWWGGGGGKKNNSRPTQNFEKLALDDTDHHVRTVENEQSTGSHTHAVFIRLQLRTTFWRGGVAAHHRLAQEIRRKGVVGVQSGRAQVGYQTEEAEV